MNYLLDVNALVALGFLEHSFHVRVASWANELAVPDGPTLLTCSITELGFVRVLAQVPHYGVTVSQARTLLLRLKKSKTVRFRFLSDNHDVSHMPAWVMNPKQTTDGHLAELAKAHDAILATLDARIPRAFVIPQ